MSCLGLLLAAACLWLIQGILYKHLWKRGLSASVAFDQPCGVEGEQASLTETITNAKYLPLPALHVKFQMGRGLVFLNGENSSVTDQNYRSDIFSCMPWQKIRRRLEFQCEKRGLYTIRQIDLVSYDLLWTSQFYRSLPADTAMYVYPAFVDPVRLSLPLRRLNGSLAARQSLEQDPFELASIRDYAPGDPYRDINWKATARTGGFKVNVHPPAAFWQVTLLLDGSSDRLWEDDDLREESVRLCGTLADRLLAQGILVSVRSNGLDCLTQTEAFLPAGAGQHQLGHLLRLLARIQFPADRRRPMEELIDELLNAREPAGKTADTTLYLLISPCQRESLTAAYERLCRRSPGSQWILPLRPGDPIRLNAPGREPLENLYPWEVSYAPSNRFQTTH